MPEVLLDDRFCGEGSNTFAAHHRSFEE